MAVLRFFYSIFQVLLTIFAVRAHAPTPTPNPLKQAMRGILKMRLEFATGVHISQSHHNSASQTPHLNLRMTDPASPSHSDQARFTRFAELCEGLAATSSKLAKRALIAAYLSSLDDASASLAATFLIGRPFPESDPRTLGVGGRALSDALLQLTGAPASALSAGYRLHGDLGAAAHDLLLSAAASTPSNLTLAEVADSFDRLAATTKRTPRLGLLLHLLGAASPIEAKYLIKIILGDMRTGVQQSLVEEAIAASATVPLTAIRRAVLFSGDLGVALRAARHSTLDDVTLALFHPLGFMLASPIETPEEAIQRLLPQVAVPEAILPEPPPSPISAPPSLHIEDKFDGMRAQAHCAGPAEARRVVLYSRNRQDVTASFPELAAALASIPVPCILDGEILGWDPVRLRALPFATFSNRLGRKHVNRELLQSTPVAFLAFDCLYADGRVLLDEPLTARRVALAEILAAAASAPAAIAASGPSAAQSTLFGVVPETPEVPAPLLLSPVAHPSTIEQIEAEFLFARARGNEGLMIKDPNSLYTPGRRGYAWLKFKQELATIDVVITGAEFGHGRRAGILSDYTFAVRGNDGSLLNVGKAYSGLTDVEISTLSDWCMQHTLIDHGHFRTVEPEIVLEVACNNVMRSGRHNSGFALRFPRIVRLRPDKSVNEIDTLERVEEIYASQPDKPAELDTAPPEAATEN
jgi:DNA ligase-1